ncbi:MAG: hypothetical protein KC635_23380 [Myxococcales bacterium]|nr:hypothetical protein [Myxococcales bacterium]
MRRTVAIALALGLLVVSAAAFVLSRVRTSSTTGSETVQRAAEIVRAGFADGDAVRASPFWAMSPYWFVQGAGPGAERYPFPALMAFDDIDPVDLVRFARLWVIGLHGRGAPPPDSVAAALTLDEQQDVGDGAVVARYLVDRVVPLHRMTEELEKLEVRRRAPDGAVTPCPYSGGRHRCGREPWFDLHIQDRDVSQRDVHWIFAHPGPGAIALEVDWPELAPSSWVVLRMGFTLAGIMHKEGEDTVVRVSVDGAEIDRFTLAPHVYTREVRAYELPPGGDAGPTFSFAVQTGEEHGWRELMVEGDDFPTLPPIVEAAATFVRRLGDAPTAAEAD